jgi:hypothetical protein
MIAETPICPERLRRLAVPRRAWLPLLVLLASHCSRDAGPAPNGIVGWRTLGSWSGAASLQTETFTSDTGSFRVHWRATPSPAVADGAARREGSLHVVFRSADSGNPIIDAVVQRGPGEGVASVSAERPRWYYLGIESAGVNWTVRVEEPLFGRSVTGER